MPATRARQQNNGRVAIILDATSLSGLWCGMEHTKLIAKIEKYCAAAGIMHSTFGEQALKNPRYVVRLRQRAEDNAKEIARIEAYIAANPARDRKRRKSK